MFANLLPQFVRTIVKKLKQNLHKPDYRLLSIKRTMHIELDQIDYTDLVRIVGGKVFMARKSQHNPARSKTTARAKPSPAAAPTKLDTQRLSPPISEPKISEPKISESKISEPNGEPKPDPANGIHELQQQFAALKTQLETVQNNYAALQQTSAEQARAIEMLQGQLEQRKLEQSSQQENYGALQQKAIEQAQIIEQLRGQIAGLDQQMEQRLSDQMSQLKLDAAASQTGSDTVTIEAFNQVQQQVGGLQADLNYQVAKQMTQEQRYEVLRRQCDEQEKVIAELRSLVVQEQRYAAIGEAHLNKWRYRTFSS